MTSGPPYVRKVRVLAHELPEIPSDYGGINPVNRIPAVAVRREAKGDTA